LKEVVHLTGEVATLQSVKSKSGMQKLASEAGLGGMRVTDKLKNALKALAVMRNDLLKITTEKTGIGEELKILAQERDMLQEKLSNLNPKLDALFAREMSLLSDLESESNARKRLAAAADEQKIVIVDLQKQLVQVQSKIGLMQRARAKAGEADDDIAAQTSQLLARTRMAADKSTALFSDLEGDMPMNPNDKCIQADVQGAGGRMDQATLFQNLLDTAKAEVALSRTRLKAAEKEIEEHLAQIGQQRAHIYKLENAPPPPGPDTYDVFCQTNPIFIYAEDMAAKIKDIKSAHDDAIAVTSSAAADALADAEFLRSDIAQLSQRLEIESKSVDALREERSMACAAMSAEIGGGLEVSEGKGSGNKKGKGKEKDSKEGKDGKETKDKSAKKKDEDKGESKEAKNEEHISGRVSAHIASCAQTAVVRSDTKENILACATQLAEFLEAAAQDAVMTAKQALAAAEKEVAAAKKEIGTVLERCNKAEESLNKVKSDKDAKAKAAETKAAEERAKKEADAAAAAVAAQFAAAAAAEAKAAEAEAKRKKAIVVVDASVNTDVFDGCGSLLSKMFESKHTLASLTVQLQNIRSKGLFKGKSDNTPSKIELQLSQQVKRLGADLGDMHVKLASIVPDYIPPSPEKMEEYALSDAAAAAALADSVNNPRQLQEPAVQVAAVAAVCAPGVSDATQTSRASTSHGPGTPGPPIGTFNLADEARRLKHEDRSAHSVLFTLQHVLLGLNAAHFTACSAL
jgi:hypothetical protein